MYKSKWKQICAEYKFDVSCKLIFQMWWPYASSEYFVGYFGLSLLIWMYPNIFVLQSIILILYEYSNATKRKNKKYYDFLRFNSKNKNINKCEIHSFYYIWINKNFKWLDMILHSFSSHESSQYSFLYLHDFFKLGEIIDFSCQNEILNTWHYVCVKDS